ncbi:MAG: HEPN domain-containing protein [Leptospiraceae bacterium]|nr:HEPN domain-containing protein [Leptospiraceae bacterium]
MNREEKDNYVKYRLEKAEETYEVAELLIENEKWNSAVNRLYYASFYAVTGLLVNSEIATKSHSGVKTQFFLNFIKRGIIDQESGKLYGDLFDWRQKGDYGDFFDFEEKDVKPLLEPTRKLIDQIKKEIEKK